MHTQRYNLQMKMNKNKYKVCTSNKWVFTKIKSCFIMNDVIQSKTVALRNIQIIKKWIQ